MAVTKRQAQEKSINGRPGELSGVKSDPAESLTKKPGRQRKGAVEAGIQQILDGAAPYAAVLLRDHIRKVRGVKSLKPSLQRACEYVIDHAIGKSRQKIEHSGGILTYAALAKSARDLDEKPRPILAELDEILAKHPQEPVAPNPELVSGEENKEL